MVTRTRPPGAGRNELICRSFWPPAPAKTRLHETVPVSDQYAEGDARRGGRGEPAAHAARRTDPAPGRRHLHVAADGPAHAVESEPDRARGDEPRRRARASDAGGATCRALAGVDPLEQ